MASRRRSAPKKRSSGSRQVQSRRPAGKPAAHREAADQHASDELLLYIENTSDLSPDGPIGQGRSVLLNALRKWRKGTYDPALAVRLFEYLVESGAKRYAKEFDSERNWSTMFNPATRHEVARELEASFRNRVENGEYDHVDTKIGARETREPRGGSGGGNYSLRQSPDSATKFDAYFDRLRIGSVRGPFSDRKGERSFYDWTLNGPRGQAIGRARTQTLAFNQLIRKHKEWRATGADRSQVQERQASRDDRPISMTYGQLPPADQFERDVRTRINPDDDEPYWPKDKAFPMELVDRGEIELAESYGLDEFEAERRRTGRNTGVRGFRVETPSEMYSFLEYLTEENDNGNDTAGNFASSIMTVLGYEWI